MMPEERSMITIIFFFVIVAVLIWIFVSSKEDFQRFGGPSLANACEFNRECLYDNARTIGMSNGMEGVCTTHGLACPSFMLSQNQYLGNDRPLSPEEYQQLISNF